MRLLLLVLTLAGMAHGAPAVTHTRTLAGGHDRVASPAPFRAVAILWNRAADGVPVRLRVSKGDDAWSEWLPVVPDDSAPPERATGLVFLGEAYTQLEVEGAPDGAGVIFIDPGVTPTRAMQHPKSVAPGTIAAPPMVMRSEWGCTPAACPQASAPQYTTVTHLIVHHTDGANSATDWAAVVRSIWVLHVQGNGWNDIGYNYLVAPDGTLFEGRAGGDGVLGAHFSSVNGGTMGVALMGTYSTVRPADAGLTTLAAMLTWQADKWHLDPMGESFHASSGLVLNTISGHRDANYSTRASGSTECPGNGLYTQLPAVRAAVRQQLRGACAASLSQLTGCAGNAAGTLDLAVTSRPGCAVVVASPAAWLTSQAIDGGVRLAFTANSGARRAASVSIGGDSFTLTQSGAGEGALACIARGSTPVVADSAVAIYGTNLAPAEAFAASVPLPNLLAGVGVTVDGKPAPLAYVSPRQINFQVPPGASIGTARVAVTVNGLTGPDAYLSITEANPVLVTTAGGRAAAINYDDGRPNSPSAPVRAGSIVSVWLTGGGAVTGGFPVAGMPAPAQPRAATLPATATVAGRAARLLYLGLAPGTVGAWQANVEVPAGLAAGDADLWVTVAGASGSGGVLSVAQ